MQEKDLTMPCKLSNSGAIIKSRLLVCPKWGLKRWEIGETGHM